jgi:ABC-type multidrug transport system ATPase subunit
MALVTLRDVDFAYDERPVLRRISFDLQDGDFVGIVGPNGSGKSTLIDLIDGLQQPGAGEVLISGVPTRKIRRRQMACEVADETIQIHGGWGYMKEYEVERHYRDVRLNRIGAGTDEIMLEVIGRSYGL